MQFKNVFQKAKKNSKELKEPDVVAHTHNLRLGDCVRRFTSLRSTSATWQDPVELEDRPIEIIQPEEQKEKLTKRDTIPHQPMCTNIYIM